jgi:hypothetical protein
MAKGDDVKNKTISDTFHVKQDIHHHLKYFAEACDKKKFSTLMTDAMDALTSAQVAEKALDNSLTTYRSSFILARLMALCFHIFFSACYEDRNTTIRFRNKRFN